MINKRYYVKQTNTTFWERFGITDSAIALEHDTTAPPGSPNNSYDAAPHGSMWMPRSWTVGQETAFSTTITNSPNNNSKTPNKLCNGGVFQALTQWVNPGWRGSTSEDWRSFPLGVWTKTLLDPSSRARVWEGPGLG